MISRRPGAPLDGRRDPSSTAKAPGGKRGSTWSGLLSAAAIAALGAHTLLGMERLRPLEPATAPPSFASAALPTATTQPGLASWVPAHLPHRAEPELPVLVMGPLKPERVEAVEGGAVRGPNWKLPPLPPLPPGTGGLFADLPAPEPAVPLAIVPRLPPGKPGTSGAARAEREPDAAPRAAPRRPATTPSRPLTLRLSLTPSESSVHGPGDWLKVRASASLPCYLVVLHVDGDRDVTILFPRRFDLVYQPNVSYSLITRSDPGEHGEVVVAVASVHPLNAADALAAILAGKGQTPSSSRGLLATDLWSAVEQALRGRAGGNAEFEQWEPHAWRLAIATHRPPRPELVEPADGQAEPDPGNRREPSPHAPPAPEPERPPAPQPPGG